MSRLLEGAVSRQPLPDSAVGIDTCVKASKRRATVASFDYQPIGAIGRSLQLRSSFFGSPRRL